MRGRRRADAAGGAGGAGRGGQLLFLARARQLTRQPSEGRGQFARSRRVASSSAPWLRAVRSGADRAGEEAQPQLVIEAHKQGHKPKDVRVAALIRAGVPTDVDGARRRHTTPVRTFERGQRRTSMASSQSDVTVLKDVARNGGAGSGRHE